MAVKSGRDTDGRRVGVPSENIVIQNCTHLRHWGALTVGSEMSGGVRNVFFEESKITGVSISHSTFTKIGTATPKIKNANKPTYSSVTVNGKPPDLREFRQSVHYGLNITWTGRRRLLPA